jgi:Uma2 family endonuclease
MLAKIRLMAPGATSLTLDEYDRVYGSEAGWEYWFGQVRAKPVPTQLHGLLQTLLAELLRLAGYVSIVEADLRIVPGWSPRPDVYGIVGKIEGRYATRPVDVVFEIVSPQEDIETKCELYRQSLIPVIFVFDPAEQTITSWDGQRFVPVTDVELANGVTITGATIWSQFMERQQQQPPVSTRI